MEEYFGEKTIKSRVFGWLLPYLKQQDLSAAGRVTSFIAISEDSRSAIRKFYNRDADVLYCPIDHDRFLKGMEYKKEDHYLIVSRLERWKNLEYAVKAFNHSGRCLKIIGTGEQEEYLKSISGDNIKFLGNVDDDTLVAEYGRARAVIFTPALEYGLVPLEASAAGTPVVALGKRGVTETMIPFGVNPKDDVYPTAVFFDEPSPSALNNALEIFERTHFDREYLTSHAKKFSIPVFRQAMRNYVENSRKREL
jgi:glycosyltransferase involved in cell wall biosynthesis